jgi:V/A-type H+-transporting ATPase subunit K
MLMQVLIVMMFAMLSVFVITTMATATTPDVDADEDNSVDVPQQFGQGDDDGEETNETKAQTTKAMIAIGAGIAIGIAGIGSATGIGIAGAAGIGACAEKPDRFGKSLILQALPMTQGIYGLLTAILLLMGAGLLGGGKDQAFYVDPLIGLSAIAIGLAVGLTGISAIGQGITAGASIGGTARNPDVFSKGMIFTVMSETLAIFGLLVGILIMVGVGLF